MPRDYTKAAYWYRKAADQGDADAEFNLGILYFNGYGMPKNYNQAAYWYKKSAAQGDVRAELNLGMLCDYYGPASLRNYVKAAYWYKKAAAHNNILADIDLSVLYSRGQGLPKNYIAAYKWCLLAKLSAGPRNSMYNDIIRIMSNLAYHMKPKQIEKARNAAVHYKLHLQ